MTIIEVEHKLAKRAGWEYVTHPGGRSQKGWHFKGAFRALPDFFDREIQQAMLWDFNEAERWALSRILMEAERHRKDRDQNTIWFVLSLSGQELAVFMAQALDLVAEETARQEAAAEAAAEEASENKFYENAENNSRRAK